MKRIGLCFLITVAVFARESGEAFQTLRSFEPAAFALPSIGEHDAIAILGLTAEITQPGATVDILEGVGSHCETMKHVLVTVRANGLSRAGGLVPSSRNLCARFNASVGHAFVKISYVVVRRP